MSVGEETRNLTSPPEFCGGAEPTVSHLEATLSVVFISKEKKGIQKEREKPMEREEIVICHRSPLCFFVRKRGHDATRLLLLRLHTCWLSKRGLDTYRCI